MSTRTITVHDRCIECGKVLHSMREGESGLCGTCGFVKMPADTKRAMSKLLASAFDGSTDEQKDKAVREAMDLTGRDEKEKM